MVKMEKDTVKKPPGPRIEKPAEKDGRVHAQVAAAQVRDILSVLLAFRFINSLFVKTFFQPDEYFQALEPAWRMAFGEGSGAWMTWVFSLIGFDENHVLTDMVRNGNINCGLHFTQPYLAPRTSLPRLS